MSDMMPSIKAVDARARLASGTAILVDVREPLEHAREFIMGAVSMPLSSLDPEVLPSGFKETGAPAVIFHCQSGQRTAQNAARLGQCGALRAYLLEGGLNAWKAAGFATVIDRTKPIELQRQVQIAAGSLVLTGLALSALSPWLLVIPAFVGSGLVFAGLSGWCGMAKLLAAMPWNRVQP